MPIHNPAREREEAARNAARKANEEAIARGVKDRLSAANREMEKEVAARKPVVQSAVGENPERIAYERERLRQLEQLEAPSAYQRNSIANLRAMLPPEPKSEIQISAAEKAKTLRAALSVMRVGDAGYDAVLSQCLSAEMDAENGQRAVGHD